MQVGRRIFFLHNLPALYYNNCLLFYYFIILSMWRENPSFVYIYSYAKMLLVVLLLDRQCFRRTWRTMTEWRLGQARRSRLSPRPASSPTPPSTPCPRPPRRPWARTPPWTKVTYPNTRQVIGQLACSVSRMHCCIIAHFLIKTEMSLLENYAFNSCSFLMIEWNLINYMHREFLECYLIIVNRGVLES